jgi:hypothetical protein
MVTSMSIQLDAKYTAPLLNITVLLVQHTMFVLVNGMVVLVVLVP